MKKDFNQNRINSLDGIKAIMLVLIFCWHTPTNPSFPFSEPIVDLGARMCEVLFVTSGFLVAYNHYENTMPITLKDSLKYVLSKIKKVWPIHFIAFVMIVLHSINNNTISFDISTIYKAIINLLLLQAWSNDPFSFNGVTWFISALLFCYFMTPLLISIVKRTKRINLFMFVGLMILRIVLELSNIIPFDYHTSPIIRCIEYFIGMLMLPMFYKIKSTLSKSDNTNIMSVIELLLSAIYVFLIIYMQGKWIRGYFVIAACVLVFTYSLNNGLLSSFLSSKIFSLFSMIQVEFYIFHKVIIEIFDPVLSRIIHSVFIESVILFCMVIIISVLYRIFLKKKCTLFMEKIIKV